MRSMRRRRRVALARVALSQAPFWLLDEPLNALDAPAQAAFRAVLQKHLAAGDLAIAATHADLGIGACSLGLQAGAALSPRPRATCALAGAARAMSPSCSLSLSWRPCCFPLASGPRPTCSR